MLSMFQLWLYRMINAVRAEVQIMRSDVVFKQIADESGIQLKNDSSAPADDAVQGRDSNVASANVGLQPGLLYTLVINPDIDM